jgi:drug/metabolite transporter (DMT)-like permease
MSHLAARSERDDVTYGSLEIGSASDGLGKDSELQNKSVLLTNFLLCISVGPLNFVMYKVMYAAFGDKRAFFVSQGVNFLYVLYGGIILHILSSRGEIGPETRKIPHYKFVLMGFLDCMGGFLGAMGANGTSGSLQQLLNQTLIPITMLLSWIFLRRQSSWLQIFGAVLILFGAWIVLSSSLVGDDLSSNLNAIANIIYLSSNIPIAFSSIYKEYGFRNVHMHVMYMTQWVSVYQLLWGFLAGFLQQFPGMGSMQGLSVKEISTSFVSGLLCFFHIDKECADRSAFWLLTGYCVVNFVFNTVGLVLMKYDSATLSTITNALVLPLTILAFNLSIMGPYQENCSPDTWLGLIVVLIGFSFWKLKRIELHCGKSVEAGPECLEEEQLSSDYKEDENTKWANALVIQKNRRGRESVSCAMVSASFGDSLNRDKEKEGKGPEAFSDRVIFLSLDAE